MRDPDSLYDLSIDGASVPRGLHLVAGLTGFGSVDSQGRLSVDSFKRVTFGTYFNAFPASYWRRWTIFDTVKLRVRMSGQGTLIVYRSTSKGHVLRAESRSVDSTTWRSTARWVR